MYWIFGGVSLSEVGSGDGSVDTGLGGRSIAKGDAHFRIVFEATSLPAALGIHRRRIADRKDRSAASA